jgi:beta-phosphoglucomutase family hydrolase
VEANYGYFYLMKTRAFLFDLNGTMIDDMNYHITAWLEILKNMGNEISFEKMKEECYGKNEELLERIIPGRFSEADKKKLGAEKEKTYREHFKPNLRLLPGLDKFLENAYHNEIKLGIGSAAIMDNVNFVIDGMNIRHYFSAIISADDVTNSKPDPETFLKCAELLQAEPQDCVVFEDTPKGVETAVNAGMQAFVLTTLHKDNEFEKYPNIIGFAKDYSLIDPDLMQRLYGKSFSGSQTA